LCVSAVINSVLIECFHVTTFLVITGYAACKLQYVETKAYMEQFESN